MTAGLQERGLDQILGVAAVAGEQVRRPQQRGPVGDDEFAEPRVVLLTHCVPFPACPLHAAGPTKG